MWIPYASTLRLDRFQVPIVCPVSESVYCFAMLILIQLIRI